MAEQSTAAAAAAAATATVTANATVAQPTKKRASTPIRSKSQSRIQRVQLIAALGRHKPKDATALQYYNFLREHCIMHNCSIDEAIEQAETAWPKVTEQQRALYASEKHAELPIPVPTHLIYRAFQMERDGRLCLGRAPIGEKGATMYTVEAYRPPRKQKPPRYIGHVLRNSKQAAVWGATAGCGCRRQKSRNSGGERAPQRLLTPPPLRHKSLRVRSLTRILSQESVEDQMTCRRKQPKTALRGKQSHKLLGILLPPRRSVDTVVASGAGGDSKDVPPPTANAAVKKSKKSAGNSKKSPKKSGSTGEHKKKRKSAEAGKSVSPISAPVGVAALRHLAQHYPRPSS